MNGVFDIIFNSRTHARVPSDTKEFHEVTKRDALRQLERELDKLIETSPADKKDAFREEMSSFAGLFGRFLQEDGPSVAWNKIEKLPEGAVKDYSHLQTPTNSDQIRAMLNKLVVVKLNGGLGTSMGCHGPKSVIPVRNDLTFLDLTVQQIESLNKTYNANVPLVLMNSFNTDEDTEKIVRKYKGFQVNIYSFNQSAFPRISRDSLLPVARKYEIEDNMEAWYPPVK